jgi:3'-phosphoadenosine 5'-phosphosulfate sulfotransferase (PAPS reductase)/FAD synthetase
MVKKRLSNGDPCEKCAQTEDMLRRRGLWNEIDAVVWALEGDDQSAGAALGRKHGVAVAPFFVLNFEDGTETVYTSAMRMIRDHFSALAAVKPVAAPKSPEVDILEIERALDREDPVSIVRLALERFGNRCAVVLTGAEDVVLVDMASKTGLPFRTVFVDTGRLHAETYSLIDDVGRHYGIEIQSALPDPKKLIALINEKGQNSFLRDGHHECCEIRRVEPLKRALKGCDAFISLHGMGRELTTFDVPKGVEVDTTYSDNKAASRVRFNPLVAWDSNRIWSYVRNNSVLHNELHVAGYRFIGCQPCTRIIRRDQSPSEGLWWWEEEGNTASEQEHHGDGI